MSGFDRNQEYLKTRTPEQLQEMLMDGRASPNDVRRAQGLIPQDAPCSVPSFSGAITSARLTATSVDFGPIKVFPDGGIERTARFTTTEAAAIEFWTAVERFMPLKAAP